MNNGTNSSRRNFIKQSSLGLGAGVINISNPFINDDQVSGQKKKLPGELCIVSIDLKSLISDATSESRVKQILQRMQVVAGMHPDVICLPELFSTMWVQKKKTLSEIAEDEITPGPVTSRIAAFAKQNDCYVVCPLYTRKGDHFYNSSLLIDRKGAIAGVYNKIYPVKSEILPSRNSKVGITPGALDQPVIETDFGKVGMQICYDANWSQGWDNLKNKGADIVFFSSAFPGGRMLNYQAFKNNCYIVTSTLQKGKTFSIKIAVVVIILSKMVLARI